MKLFTKKDPRLDTLKAAIAQASKDSKWAGGWFDRHQAREQEMNRLKAEFAADPSEKLANEIEALAGKIILTEDISGDLANIASKKIFERNQRRNLAAVGPAITAKIEQFEQAMADVVAHDRKQAEALGFNESDTASPVRASLDAEIGKGRQLLAGLPEAAELDGLATAGHVEFNRLAGRIDQAVSWALAQ